MGNDQQYIRNNCGLAVDRAYRGVDIQGMRKGLYSQLFFIFFIHLVLQVLYTFRYKPRDSTYSQPPIQQKQHTQAPIKQEVQIRQNIEQTQPQKDQQKQMKKEQMKEQIIEQIKQQIKQQIKDQKIQQIQAQPEITERKISVVQKDNNEPVKIQKQKQKQKQKQPVRKSVPIQPQGDPRPQLPWHDKRWNRNFSIIFSTHAVALGMVLLFSPFAGALVIAYLHLLCFIIYTFCQARKMLFVGKITRTVMDLLNLVLILIGTIGINQLRLNSNNICLKDA